MSEFTRLDQESDMTDLPRTVITLTGDRGPLHVAKGVLVNGSPVALAEHGVDIDFGPDEVTTVTLRLLADEVHFVKEAPEPTPHATGAAAEFPPAEPAPADVDPDEALAKVLRLTAGRPGFSFPWGAITQDARDEYLNLAYAAREHIEAEADDADFSAASLHYARAERAEADLARVTKERDGWRTKAQKIWNDTHSWLATIEPDDGGAMPVTRGRRDALINTIDRLWWSEPFFNPESPMRDDERGES